MEFKDFHGNYKLGGNIVDIATEWNLKQVTQGVNKKPKKVDIATEWNLK